MCGTVTGARGFIGYPLVRRLLATDREDGAPPRDVPRADLCADGTRLLECEQWVPRPPSEVFPFFADAHNLERITPPFLHFRVVAVTPPAIEEGTQIEYRLRLHGVPLRWISRIESWQPGRQFVDRQLRGPYALWHHTHEFEAAAEGTLMRDRVRYAVPFGAVGELVAGRFVARDVAAIFAYRRRKIGEIFGGSER